MKKSILTFIIFAGITVMAAAQSIHLVGYSSYVFDDKVDSYYDPTNYYSGTINGGYSWGAGLEFMAAPTKGIELKYLHRTTTAPMEYYKNGVKYKTFDLGLNYIMIGANNYFKTGGKVEPYAGADLGVALFYINNAEAGSDDNATKFAWDIKLGANIWFNEKVALKLQADLLSAVQSAGGGLYFGTGGASAGIGMYSTMYQWGLGGGLVFKLK
ncbi:MAG: porin family protein [Bacteroidota bacterium]